MLWRGRIIAWGVSALAALIAFAFAPKFLTGLLRAVVVWDAASLSMLAMIWTTAMSSDPNRTRMRAAVEDPGRNVITIVIIVACAIGLAAAVGILGFEQHYAAHARGRIVVILALVAITTSWLLIHTTMILRYAHLFYSSDQDGGSGLEFPGTTQPSDRDFAYFSFVLGMTFQVSDVQITDSDIRQTALVHGLISFAFNAAIIAVTVNIATGLLH